VLKRPDFERLGAIGSVPMKTIGRVTYWNTAGVRLRTLLAPIPEEDLDTVVLVTNR
jgi:hypothetical protein